jgi:hypothetical protein
MSLDLLLLKISQLRSRVVGAVNFPLTRKYLENTQHESHEVCLDTSIGCTLLNKSASSVKR